ncbi:hypothetical protein M408DRAFT_230035 [Serendipita vermifera MAFF 305830]|uniref:Uncharacterized protein n=1 Tax=Serendipita vermifera MAFF 305830 TaxID=933852 RepID=A0A0C3AJ91_SERVB|nr:hypothetical protein M408DRAFT_230035 [Serendipita vermifera MAFF 305830]
MMLFLAYTAAIVTGRSMARAIKEPCKPSLVLFSQIRQLCQTRHHSSLVAFILMSRSIQLFYPGVSLLRPAGRIKF